MAGGANQTLRERRNGGSSSNHKNINIIEHFRSPSNLYFDDSVVFDFFPSKVPPGYMSDKTHTCSPLFVRSSDRKL